MKRVCVYDLSRTGEFRLYEIGEKESVLLFKAYFPPAIVLKDNSHINSKCALFNPDAPDYSSIYEYKDGMNPSFIYHNDYLLTLPEIMYSFCYDAEENKPYDQAKGYFEALKKWVSSKLKEEQLIYEQTILLVPDSLPIESQEKLLSFFGKRKTLLLWRSIAIILGSEEKISFVQNSDCIAVLDRLGIGMLYSRIETKRENGRVIPCHKIFRKANGQLNRDWYSNSFVENERTELENIRRNRIEECFRLQDKTQYPYFNVSRGHAGFICVSENKCRVNFQKLPNRRVSAILFSHKNDRDSSFYININLNSSAFDGACKYIQYVNAGEVPYYDECESFSVVYQTKKEEIRYFELISADSYLPAGKETEGNQIEELAISKGNKNAVFYFHLGNILDSLAQLRVFTQEFPIERPLVENRPLLMKPSIMPGQGYASVKIEDGSDEKLFPPIELDWKTMELAFYSTDERTSRKIPITKEFLEIRMERSFPPDVPPVRCRYKNGDIPSGLRLEIESFVKHGQLYERMFYNNSIWPYIADSSKGVERFVRENVFGSYSDKYQHQNSFPDIYGIKEEEYLARFEALSRRFVNSCNGVGPDMSLIPWMAWSYQRFDLNGNLLPYAKSAMNCILDNLASKKGLKLDAATASFFANMTATQSEFERILSLFKNRLRISNDGISNWCRAIYQVLMYTPFIYSNSSQIGNDSRYCMSRLCECLLDYDNMVSETITDNILRVMLYFLRRRVIDKSFCRKGGCDNLYDKVLYSLNVIELKSNKRLYLLQKGQSIKASISTIKMYLDGHGTLDGIPSPND